MVRRYVVNQYGITSSPLQGGLPSDRLVAEWWLHSTRVEETLESGKRPEIAVAERVEIPAEIYAWKSQAETRTRAAEVQRRTRDLLQKYFAEGLSVVGYERDADGGGRFLLGTLERGGLVARSRRELRSHLFTSSDMRLWTIHIVSVAVLSAEDAVGFVFGVAPAIQVVFYRHESARVHAVDVERAVQVIDLVLQDAGVPALGVDKLWFAVFIEIAHAHAAVARHLGGVSGDAEAALEEFESVRRLQFPIQD